MRFTSLPLLLLPSLLLATDHGRKDLESVLHPRLSANARLVFPTDADWSLLTSRWNPYAEPTLRAAVEAATVADVQATVRFAAKRGIKLLVRNTSHGFSQSMRGVVNGLQLSIRGLSSITIDVHNNTATLGGGVVGADLITALSLVGKRTATGNCDCVGIAGAGLGGGHGRLQGLFGLISDNILSLTLVTADGTLRTVDSGPLFWALRGAGHNFGVVVELQVRIYDAAESWINAEYVYDDTVLEGVVGFLERYRQEQQPAEMTIFASFIPMPKGPSRLRVSLQYGGSTPLAEICAPFLALNPRSATNASLPYHQIATATGIGSGMGFCVPGTRRAHYSTLLKRLGVAAVREAKTFYDGAMGKHPLLGASSMVWELYPLHAVRVVSAEETAYPHRGLDIIALFMVNYYNAEDDELADEVGRQGREVLLRSAGTEGYRVYVNYALGDETNEVVYGPDPWRLQKLQMLKRRYDPKGVFNAYNPILLTENAPEL